MKRTLATRDELIKEFLGKHYGHPKTNGKRTDKHRDPLEKEIYSYWKLTIIYHHFSGASCSTFGGVSTFQFSVNFRVPNNPQKLPENRFRWKITFPFLGKRPIFQELFLFVSGITREWFVTHHFFIWVQLFFFQDSLHFQNE